mmetsp:Transcript_14003/g.40288  ORF Transcript_14003/g.40288 Transcript_14003/m.40288 type:complete len:642 (-) Transcript_14003:294-2219(-)
MAPAMQAAGAPMPAPTALCASRSRPSTTEDGLRVSRRLPRSITDRWIAGPACIKASVARWSNWFSMMNCCTVSALMPPTGIATRGTAAPPSPTKLLAASFKRPRSAADGFRASRRVPRSTTKTFTAEDDCRNASLARSSKVFSAMKVSTRMARAWSPEGSCRNSGGSMPAAAAAAAVAGLLANLLAICCAWAIWVEWTFIASRSRPVSEEEGFRVSSKLPRSMMAACTGSGARRKASLAVWSNWFSTMNVSTPIATCSGLRSLASAGVGTLMGPTSHLLPPPPPGCEAPACWLPKPGVAQPPPACAPPPPPHPVTELGGTRGRTVWLPPAIIWLPPPIVGQPPAIICATTTLLLPRARCASRRRPRHDAEGFLESHRLPRSRTYRWWGSGASRSADAARSSTMLSVMKASTAPAKSPPMRWNDVTLPRLLAPPANVELSPNCACAVFNLPSMAAEGLFASESGPRSRTARWTLGELSVSNCVARSSRPFSRTKSLTSSASDSVSMAGIMDGSMGTMPRLVAAAAASLKRPSTAAEAFRASTRLPRSMTNCCETGPAPRRASAERSSIPFSRMKASTCSFSASMFVTGVWAARPWLKNSFSLPSTAADGFLVSTNEPRDTTNSCAASLEVLSAVNACSSNWT